MRRVITSISLVIALLLIPLADKAQQPSTDSIPQSRAPAHPATPKQEPTQQSDQTIKTVVNLVDVLFTVLNRRNKLAPELEKGDFKIFDEGKPQEIRYFSRQTDLPLRIGLLMDTSNSIRERIKFEQDASVNFLFSVLRRNKDEAFVMTFDDEPQIIQPFTNDAGALRDQITRTRRAPASFVNGWMICGSSSKVMTKASSLLRRSTLKRKLTEASCSNLMRSRMLLEVSISMPMRRGKSVCLLK